MDSEEEELKSMSCFCQDKCPYGMEYGTCHTKPGGKCFTSVELEIGDDGNEHSVLSYGCLPPGEMALFQCRSTLIVSRDGKNIKCCDEYDFCNKHLLPIVEKVDIPEVDYFHSITVTVLLSSISICLLLFVTALIINYLKIKKEIRKEKRRKQDTEIHSIQIPEVNNGHIDLDFSTDDSGIREHTDYSDTNIEASCTRSGMVQTTISKQISFELLIASGKYTEVWRAKWRGERVAVKIYNQSEKENWKREIEIFQSPLLRHDHILGYIAADIKVNGPSSSRYIITEYHSLGSLRDYLKNHTVSPMELFEMTRGLAGALTHLHTEIIGSSSKPCITHNNINSTNILMKTTKQCCLGSFSKAVRFSSAQNKFDAPSNTENADIRYLAPEFLNKSFNPNTIESFKMNDVYGFALIIWEILNRCQITSLISDTKYQVPYEEELGELSLESMDELVVVKKCRPQLRSVWKLDPILKSITRIMVECWNATPSARLTGLRIKKTLLKIQAENSE